MTDFADLRYNDEVIMGRTVVTRKKRKDKKPIQEKNYEKNVSTQKETEKQGTRIPQENGDDCRQKGSEKTQSKRQKEIDPLIFDWTKTEK